MPLSEFYTTSKGKVEGSQQKNSTGLAVVPKNGLVELVCENGHIMMQDQSSSRKIPKIPTSNNLLFQTPRFLDKDIVDQTPYKVGKYGTIDSIYSDVTMSAPSGETGPSQEDDMANWFNYPIEDTLQQDYGSDFLPELSGVTVNESAIQNSFASVEKRDRYNQVVRDSSNGSVNNNDLSSGQGSASKLPSSRYAPLYPWSLQGQTSVSSVGSRVLDIMSTNTNNMQHNVSGNLISSEATVDHFSQMNMQKQDSLLPRTSSSLLNFSHFSRPAAIARATIQNASVVSATVSSGADRIVENDKVLPASCRNPVETTQLDTNCVLRKEMNYHTQPYMMSTKVDLKQVEIVSPEDHIGKSDTVSRQDASNNEKSPNQDCGGNNAAVGVTENEKAADLVGASSSVCSGNSIERASNDPRTNLKRKNCRDTEESEGQSEDVEEESVGVKKAAAARGGSGSKRSRAAEVHNLSERRRRDRINEKMRALQELIPNCNKVDKASMLDEAIEYLKTLQLQVQILSMGAGLYMPPMMLPPGMQHIHAAHLPHFSPMGVGIGMGMGMGMGMGYGMNMLGMHGGPRGCSMIPVSPMQGHFPSQPMSRSPGFHGMTGANLQVFGHPSQGIPLSVAGGSMAPVSGPPPVNSSIGMDTLRMGINMEAPNAVQAPNLDPKNLPESTNLRDMHSADASISLKHQSNQFHATNQECDQSDLVLKTDQGPDVGGSANDNSIKKKNTSPSGEVAVVDSQS